ncbi:MAG: DUF2828 family protein, partial [Oscillospiraceae bacterium]|nr:DUF2828 family protein [Oscillospiraceae bacterium]
TMKILFFARDIRGGLGERRFFRIAISTIADFNIESARKNLSLIPEYGRWDDMLLLYDTKVQSDIINIIKNQLEEDTKNMNENKEVSLLAKWLPSVNTSSNKTKELARKIASDLGMNECTYRKTLSALRKYIDILESRLCQKDYTFDYSKQPSKAMLKYRKVFLRNDKERYSAFLDNVAKGNANLNTSTLYPYEIVRKITGNNWWGVCVAMSDDEKKSLDVTWNALSDIENAQNAIAVVDGSGSMYCGGNPQPADVALSLGIYFAEHNKGAFKNHFITFSMNPKLVKVKGKDIYEKVEYASSFNECANTDIQAVFDLILKTAVKNKTPQKELPETIYIISDMEFDDCAMDGKKRFTNYETAKKKFEEKGYKLPNVVFWNVNARTMQVPVTMHESGTALVSGASPQIFDMVKSGNINPYAIMMDILSSERYSAITA